MQAALARGDRVIATARSLSSIEHLKSENCSILELDITSGSEILHQKAKEAIDIWGKVDILVNNAGYAALGIAEEAE